MAVMGSSSNHPSTAGFKVDLFCCYYDRETLEAAATTCANQFPGGNPDT